MSNENLRATKEEIELNKKIIQNIRALLRMKDIKIGQRN